MSDKLTAEQQKVKKLFDGLLKLPGNRLCADCGAKQPRWASTNLGVFVCIRCSGIHRNLGVHISKVKSVTLDKWPWELAQHMEEVGNEKANATFEAAMPPSRKVCESDSIHVVENFIRDKYQKKLWYKPLKEGKQKSSSKSSSKTKSKPKKKQREERDSEDGGSDSTQEEEDGFQDSRSDSDSANERAIQAAKAAKKKKQDREKAEAAAAVAVGQKAPPRRGSGNAEIVRQMSKVKLEDTRQTTKGSASAKPAANLRRDTSFDVDFDAAFSNPNRTSSIGPSANGLPRRNSRGTSKQASPGFGPANSRSILDFTAVDAANRPRSDSHDSNSGFDSFFDDHKPSHAAPVQATVPRKASLTKPPSASFVNGGAHPQPQMGHSHVPSFGHAPQQQQQVARPAGTDAIMALYNARPAVARPQPFAGYGPSYGMPAAPYPSAASGFPGQFPPQMAPVGGMYPQAPTYFPPAQAYGGLPQFPFGGGPPPFAQGAPQRSRNSMGGAGLTAAVAPKPQASALNDLSVFF